MRALKLALLILALVPTLWLHGGKPPEPHQRDIGLVDLMPSLRGDLPDTGALRLEGAWQITSRARALGMGTLSALAQTSRGLAAVGDRGAILWFTRPDRPGPWHAVPGRLINLDWHRYRYPTDSESVFVEPGSGDLIVAYEDAQTLERFSADLSRRSAIPLPVLAEWPENKGAEGMTRLADGRTVIVGETYSGWLDRTRHPGLIFPGTPRPFETPRRFELVMPAGTGPANWLRCRVGACSCWGAASPSWASVRSSRCLRRRMCAPAR